MTVKTKTYTSRTRNVGDTVVIFIKLSGLIALLAWAKVQVFKGALRPFAIIGNSKLGGYLLSREADKACREAVAQSKKRAPR